MGSFAGHIICHNSSAVAIGAKTTSKHPKCAVFKYNFWRCMTNHISYNVHVSQNTVRLLDFKTIK